MQFKRDIFLVVVNLLLIAFLAFKHHSKMDHEDPELVQLLHKIRSSGHTPPQDLLANLNIKIRAIWTNKCFQCHSSEKRKGELALDTYEGVLAGGEDGEIIIKGRGSQSEIIRRLKLPRGEKHAMPQKGNALTPLQISAIATWIDHGAYWVDSTIKLFYEAPLSLVKPELPPARSDISQPIDLFVDQYFKQNRIRWPKPLTDLQFVRKIYLDITGLLPPPEALDQFIKDSDAQKRNALIQKLMADDENYTLHWLSFWNDILRNDYSGTGYITGGRKQISHWLYQSLKEDSSYVDMVRSLIRPHPKSEGFIGGIQWRGEVNSSQSTEMQAAQNVSQTLLGLNLKCASCHNSFVNNLTLNQSYGFASVFAKQPLELYRCDVATGIRSKPSFIYPELGQITADSLKDRLAQLADIIVAPANGRLYRTFVNRVWAQLLGRGFIGKVDEMDLKPWSPQLLDYIASDFRDHQSNIKYLIRNILQSRTYQSQALDYGSDDELTKPGFVFKGPSVRRLHAEQIIDAVSHCIQPIYTGVAFDPTGYKIPAQWIWFPEKEFDRIILPKPDTVFLRRTIQLPPLLKAELLVTADDEFNCFINEKHITGGLDYRDFHALNVTSSCVAGKNILAIKAINNGNLHNPAGVLFYLRAISVKGDTTHIYSDKDWLAKKHISGDSWTKLNYKDQDWVNIHRYGSYENSYWGKLRRFNFDTVAIPAFSRAALVSADPLLKALGRPTRENVTTRRNEEPGLLSAIALSNDPLLHQRIQEGSINWLTKYKTEPDLMINQLYLQLLNRLPSKTEKQKMMDYFQHDPTAKSIADLIWVLVVSPEFQLI